jgi:hypothetical protein
MKTAPFVAAALLAVASDAAVTPVSFVVFFLLLPMLFAFALHRCFWEPCFVLCCVGCRKRLGL